MIATLSSQSMRMSTVLDHSFSRNANTAGGPLPSIPRRSHSASRIHSFHSTPVPRPASPVMITVQQATPPEDQPITSKPMQSASSSSSSESEEQLSMRSKKSRGVRTIAQLPSEPPSPTPVPVRSKKGSRARPRLPAEFQTPAPVGSLHLNLDKSAPSTSEPIPSGDSNIESASTSGSSQSQSAPIQKPSIVRKKSGQVVRSSLKSSKSAPRGSLSVLTGFATSKSEPNTPSLSKNVHFDAHLEHVKLFLAEQKPLAVSRDGSPTDDTSGTDSDFPAFIFGESSEKKQGKLAMQVVNMPAIPALNADVVLLELKLSSDGCSILGRVRVRNLAFQKWLAVRFTFDAWQTTSEVTGKYAETVDQEFDIFSFSIRLNDLLARIDGKTMILALRYAVAGREIWDNNFGHNYLASFTRTSVRAERFDRVKAQASEPELVGARASDISDLRSRLEKVVLGKDKNGDTPIPLRQPPPDASRAFQSSGSFASRYDFGASLKETRKLSPTRQPTELPAFSGSTIPFPSKVPSSSPLESKIVSPPMVKAKLPLGSPRDIEDGDSFRPAPFVASDMDDTPFQLQFPSSGTRKNHQRGYFDLNHHQSVASVRRTPPGTPRMGSDPGSPTLSPVGRSYSFPPVTESSRSPLFSGALTPREALAVQFGVDGGASILSTPSILSPSESLSSSSGGTSPSESERLMLSMASIGQDESLPSPRTSYNQFLNKFCFYTGPDSDLELSSSSEASGPSRTSSMSSVEELLSTSPRLQSAFTRKTVKSSPEMHDDTAILSGASTPTAPIRSPTPIAK